MAGSQKEGSSAGKITSGLVRDTLVLQTINFVYNQLRSWRNDPDRPEGESELKLNPQLCKYLKWQAKTNFPMVTFNHEEPQAINRDVDLSATPTENVSIYGCLYTIYDPLLVIECKRLPAPERKREKEYVSGADPKHISGGIQRFKLGLHSGNLSPAVMVGYIQEFTTEHWHDQINQWILGFVKAPIKDGCVWSKKEVLGLVEIDPAQGISKRKSSHARTGGDTIEIFHLWVKMS